MQGVGKIFARSGQGVAPTDLHVESGEFVTIIGPSGCGKSTLLRLACNLVQPDQGTVTWWGAGFDGVGQSGKRLALVPQDATLMPWRSVASNIRLPLDLERLNPAQSAVRVERALSRVGLNHAARLRPAELSGGMRMRVSIARALAVEPDLLLMDEPFGALDELSRIALDEELARLCYQDGLTTLFVTHSIAEAAFLSSRVLVMAANPGRIHAEYRIDPAHVRDAAFRLSDRFSGICRDLTHLLNNAAAATSTVAR